MGVGLLHELPARRRARPRKMPGPIFLGRAHVEHIKGAPVRFGSPGCERRPVYPGNPAALGYPGRRLDRRPPPGLGNVGRPPRRTVHDLEAGQVPGHRTVLQRHDPIAEAGVAQRLRPDNAAGAAAAVDDHHRLGRRHHIGEAVDQLRARHADRGRDAVVVVLLVGPAVEDRDVGAAVDQRLQIGRRYPRRPGLVLDDLGKRLARHVNAAVEAIPGRLPSRDAAVQHRDISVAERAHAAGSAQC